LAQQGDRMKPLRRIRKHNWSVGLASGAIALAALVAGSAFGSLRGKPIDPKIIAWTCAPVLAVFGVLASSRISTALGHLVAERGARSASGAVKVVSAAVGYLFVFFSVLAVLEVSVEKILVGAGLAGVVLGIAAQQSLGNVFAGVVLLVARPFSIGDHIRVRAGALGGVFEAWVCEMSLTYVTLYTEEGLLKVPNSAMLAAGIHQLSRALPPAGVPRGNNAPAEASAGRERGLDDEPAPAGEPAPDGEPAPAGEAAPAGGRAVASP
jgi:small-conductance mechanosensitive channel